MNIYRFSANSFTSLEDCLFDPVEYSKFKYGSKRVARKYGKELAKSLTTSLLARSTFLNSIPDEIVVASAPYKYIPVASTALKDYFVSDFNSYWINKRGLAVEDLKIFRGHSYNDEYGAMSAEEREKAITADDFYIDKEFIKGKTLFLIDDIIISGAHEKRMISLLENAEFTGTVVFVYYTALDNIDMNPDIENRLNYAFVKDLFSINDIIRNDEFIFNTRVTKFLLKAPSEEFQNFIRFQSDSFIQTFFQNAQGNNYFREEAFKSNFNFLKTLV